MKSIPLKIYSWLQRSLFPTEFDKEVGRWYADGGDERMRYDYDLNGDSVVIDLGGYKGQWASDIYARYNCYIAIFEPISSFASKIQDRFAKNKKIEIFPIALGREKREEVIFLGEDGSSMYRRGMEKDTIQIEDVMEFFSNHQIESVDLIKINIEGGEYEVLPRLIETGLVSKIKNLQIQFHNISPDSEAQMQKIKENLAETHAPTYQYKFVWENWRRRDV